MKLQIAGNLAAGLLFAAAPAFAQAPPTAPTPSTIPSAHTNMNKGEDKAEHKEQWKDCMARMESNNKGQKSEGQPKGEGKGTGTGKAAGTTAAGQPAPHGEGKKENRHEEEMQACRDQLYGGK
jgi:hypothetical protein